MNTDPRPLKPTLTVRDHLGQIVRLLGEHGTDICVTWSHQLAELADSGWPARTPEGDRRRIDGVREPSAIDYSDPTGETAANLERRHEITTMFEDHRHVIETSLQAMIDLAARYRPPTITEAIPQCTSARCANPVENHRDNQGKIRYRGMELTRSGWHAKPGAKPVCRTCRDRGERAA